MKTSTLAHTRIHSRSRRRPRPPARVVLLALAALWLAGCGSAGPVAIIATPTRAPLSAPPLPASGATPLPRPSQTVSATVELPSTPTPVAAVPPAEVSLLPTVTPTPERTPIAAATAAPATMPASYRVQGNFVSRTRYPDGRVTNQQGSFVILHQTTANAYGANQAYRLSTLRADGLIDTSAVYLVDDYIAVTFAEGDWIVLRRDQGSSLVAAIRPITDLAAALPTVADRAAEVGREARDGLAARHIRVTAADDLGRDLVRPILGLSGEIVDLTLDAWIVAAMAGPYVAAYDFRVDITGAAVMDANRRQVAADQTVSWSYELHDANTSLTVAWPAGAPAPRVVEVPGFAPGEFPLPARTELISIIDGVPALVSSQKEDEVAAFYHAKLPVLGWQVEGDTGLLRCTKRQDAFQLLISADPAAGGTRVTILPAP